MLCLGILYTGTHNFLRKRDKEQLYIDKDKVTKWRKFVNMTINFRTRTQIDMAY